MMIWSSVTRVGTGTTSSVSVYSNFQQKANSGTVINVSRISRSNSRPSQTSGDQ